MRDKGFGVTTIHGQGRDQAVDMLVIYLKRKQLAEAIELLHQHSLDAMITVNDVRQVRNGTLRK